MGRSRVSRIYRAGRGAFVATPTAGQDNLLRSMAAMIAEATNMRPTQRAKKGVQDGAKLPFGPGELYEACLQRVPHIIACEPYNKTWFGRLGKALQNTNGLREDDLETFVSWVENDGLDWFHNCTFAHVIKHWDGWIVKARAGIMSGNIGVSAEDYL